MEFAVGPRGKSVQSTLGTVDAGEATQPPTVIRGRGNEEESWHTHDWDTDRPGSVRVAALRATRHLRPGPPVEYLDKYAQVKSKGRAEEDEEIRSGVSFPKVNGKTAH